MQLSLDPADGLPLTEQIVRGVARQIDDRVLRPGTRLPPIRLLAERNGISRFTVVEAYDRLVAQGYLHSRRGSGFYVAPRQASGADLADTPLGRTVDTVWLLRQGFDAPGGQLVKVGSGWLPEDWMDADTLRRSLRAVARRPDVTLTHYGSAQGYLPLRRHLQVKLAGMGIGVDPAQILLTRGAHQALDLFARCLIKPGDCVFVDDPGYWTLFANLRLQGAQLVGVPRTTDGPDVTALEALLAEHRPKAFFTHSVLHNPTGANLAPANAHQILKLAERHDFLIVEDDAYCDFQPQTTPRLATLDQLERVIYIGSFSKTLSANLRVGFIACHRDLAGALTDLKLLCALPDSEFAERVVLDALTEGHYRKHMERVHGRLAEAAGRTLRMLERVGLEPYTEYRGGMFTWARVPGVADTVTLAEPAARAGLMIAYGNVFRPQSQPSEYVRINIAHADGKLERFFSERPQRNPAGPATM